MQERKNEAKAGNDMNDRLEQVIKKQDGLIAALEDQCAADQRLIDSQKKVIQAQEEKLALLEEEKQALTSAGNELCGDWRNVVAA